MEELKSETGGDVAAEAETGKRRFALPKLPPLSRRTLIIAAAVFVAIAMLVGGVVSYRAGAKQKELAAASAKKAAELEAARKEEALQLARESRDAHKSIMEASPPAAEMPAPVKEEKDKQEKQEEKTDVAKAAPTDTATSAKAPPATQKEPSSATAPAATDAAAASAPKVTAAKPAAEVSEPGAAGGCALSGQKPGDVGKALGRCLEEFNRLEGRK